MALPRIVVTVAAVGSLVAACSTDGSAPGEESPPQSPGQQISTSEILDCGHLTGTDAPANDLETVMDVAALPADGTAGTLQANPTGPEDSPIRFFAKRGLVVRAGTSFDLVVPPDERERLAISWGNADVPTWQLHVSCPHPSATWLSFPGGYFLPEPGCVSLVVRTADDEERVRVGAGAPC